ncbi:MAG: histidinol-phosphatase HisJ family protein [Erysipelotrichaceae bacterium]|nr:histidinol-phosphatase HisJ family protein [Erysipelotrichaceae bacterium]MDD3809222.1 histidinol-phosphatase HisJ family protein [Erysipelotrichaceae bacterium]
MRCDYHIHTSYSDDSSHEMEDVIIDALELGLEEICFTDHVDYGVKIDHDANVKDNHENPVMNVDYPAYFREIAILKEKYRDMITIKKGLEFGIQTHTINDFEKLYQSYEMDFVILSIHQVGDKEFWDYAFQKDKSLEEYTFAYYQELLEVVSSFKNYSVLGHLDMIVRYSEGKVPFASIEGIIKKILEVVIEDGKGIEINTSSKRYGLDDLTPSRDILRLYRELGGKIITIGSDSHNKSHLGFAIDQTRAELARLGFESYCTYESMKPIFHKLKKD